MQLEQFRYFPNLIHRNYRAKKPYELEATGPQKVSQVIFKDPHFIKAPQSVKRKEQAA